MFMSGFKGDIVWILDVRVASRSKFLKRFHQLGHDDDWLAFDLTNDVIGREISLTPFVLMKII